MKGTFKINEPAALEATLSLTMTLEEWEKLKHQIKQTGSSPGWDVKKMINTLTNKMGVILKQEITGDDE
ncbi:hypothetical protein KAR91_30130 [Candidatus Pacearchaeota archaeon]|nr:hypothetical protein [Candidatus Pacearchaeota archaeon]